MLSKDIKITETTYSCQF